MRVESTEAVTVWLSHKEAKALARVLQGVGVPVGDREAETMRLDLCDALLQHTYGG